MTGDEPAFHRHVLITPSPGAVTAWVEDDYHHMGVILRHDGTTIVDVQSEMVRAPWSTCPGAVEQLKSTFAGAVLDAVAARGEKTLNCTHLYDMAVVAAGHAGDQAPTRYAITVSDAVKGVRIAEIARDGVLLLRLVERDSKMVQPIEVEGKTLFELSGWIASLDPFAREPARLLRWAAIIAHGRAIPLERQSDASRMPSNCFTFQDGRKHRAKRVGRIIDFTGGASRPLDI